MIRITRMLVVLTTLAIFTAANIKAAGDLPATVGTVGNTSNISTANEHESDSEHEGFVIEWEDGNIYDFFQQVRSAFDFNLDSIDILGFSSSDSANANKDNSVNAHNYHKKSDDINTDLDVATNAQNTRNNSDKSEPEEQEDWRTERKWWQRGAPVL
ncbi:MAG: hypothetical protein KBD64_04405 [Gammaproteobacteria bacterium]|nr:hypothetical protein [Gammaproteobacteria bacterium]